MVSNGIELESFEECDSCRSKPGTPVLCRGCRHNRKCISSLNDKLLEKMHNYKEAEHLLFIYRILYWSLVFGLLSNLMGLTIGYSIYQTFFSRIR